METDGPSRSSVSRSWQRGSYRSRSGRRRKRRKLWGERIADWTRALIAFLFSNVGIVCLVVGYTIAGAILFTRIEGTDSPDVDNVTCLRHRTAATLWELTSKENVFSEKIWKAKVRDILETYQTNVVTAIKNGYTDGVEGSKWNFAGAFLYSLTVITTIGYGNIYPKTKWGKVVTIVYAIIGMPLFLLYLSNIGDILARSFKWTYARCCLCKCRRKPYASTRASEMPNDPAANRNRWQMVNAHSGEMDASSLEETSPRNDDNNEDDNGDGDGDDDDDDGGGVDEGDGNDEDEDDGSDSYDPQHVTVPLTLCLAIMVGYIWGGAVLFAEWEDWNLLDGSYFCFISLSTIGFGDFVPGSQIYDGQDYFKLSFIFCSMYLMLGMALIAMCFNLMQEEVMAKIRALMRIIKYIFRCDR